MDHGRRAPYLASSGLPPRISPGSMESITTSSRKSILLPIGSEYTLSAKADTFCKSQRGRVLLCDEHLKAAQIERRYAPTGQQAEGFGCDAAATGTCNHSASELARLMFAHHDHDFTEVRIAPTLGNGEMEQFTVHAVLLKQMYDRGRVSCRHGRNRECGRRILLELHGSREVLLRKRTQDERRTNKWWVWVRKRCRDLVMVVPHARRAENGDRQ